MSNVKQVNYKILDWKKKSWYAFKVHERKTKGPSEIGCHPSR